MMADTGRTDDDRDLWVRNPITPGRGSLTGRAALERRTVHIPDVLADPDYQMAEGQRVGGYRTLLGVPMFREGALIGVFALERMEAKPFTDGQITLVRTFADQAVIAIENVRLFTELQTSNHELTTALDTQTATSDILRVISRSQTDVQPVFEAIVQSAVRLLRAHSGMLTRVAGDQLELAAFTSIDGAYDAAIRAYWPRPLHSKGGHTEAIRDRAPINIADAQDDPRVPEAGRAVARLSGVRSVASVPLLRHNEAIGTVVVNRQEPGGFTDDEIALLQTFADQAVIAIENVRLFTELQEKNRALTEAHAQVTESLEQQTATAEILRVISSAHADAQPVFDTIVQSAVRLCNAANAAVFLTDGRMVYHPANYGSAHEALAAVRAQFPRPLDRSTAPGMAILTRSVVQVPDIEDPSAIEAVRQGGRLLGIRSVVMVPMLRESEPVGALGVARREPGQFSDAEVGLLTTFADQAVIAIENVRLFRETQEKNHALAQAHEEMSKAIQQQTATSEILRVISSSPTNVRPVFGAIARSAAHLTGAAMASVYEFDGSLIHLRVVEPSDWPHADEFRLNFPTTPTLTLAAGRVILERALHHPGDLPDDPDVPELTREWARRMSMRSVLWVPMLRDGAPVGVIGVTRRESGLFSDEQVRLLETFADQAVIAIENVRLFTELQQKNEALTQAHAQVTEALDQQTATSEILRVISASPTDVQPVFD